MDSLSRVEVYIPAEAEVRSIPLHSLPRNLLRKMNLLTPDSRGSEDPSSSPEGIWITPVVIRRKGQKRAAHTGNGSLENIASMFRSEPVPPQSCRRMSFVSSNKEAYRVLKDSPHEFSSPTDPPPQESSPRLKESALMIYRGTIYLSIKKPKLRPQEACDPQAADRASISPTPSSLSSSSSSSSKKRRKRLLEENDAKQASCKVSRADIKGDAPHHVIDLTSHTGHSPHRQTTTGAEAATAAQPLLLEPAGGSSSIGEEETPDLRAEEAEGSAGHHGDSIVLSSYTRRESLSTSLAKECDFEELVLEESIAQMKAKLRASEAGLTFKPSL